MVFWDGLPRVEEWSCFHVFIIINKFVFESHEIIITILQTDTFGGIAGNHQKKEHVNRRKIVCTIKARNNEREVLIRNAQSLTVNEGYRNRLSALASTAGTITPIMLVLRNRGANFKSFCQRNLCLSQFKKPPQFYNAQRVPTTVISIIQYPP